MALTPLDLGQGSDQGRKYQDGYSRHLNCYIEPRGNAGKSEAPIYAIDGLTNFTELPDPSTQESIGSYELEDAEGVGVLLTEDAVETEIALEGFTTAGGLVGYGVQSMLEVGLFLYSVAGGGLYKTDPGGYSDYLGGFAKDEPAYMAANRALPADIGVVSGGKLYVSQGGATPAQVTTNIIGSPNSIAHIDGYFVLTYPDGRWQISNIDAGTTFDSGDFTTSIYRQDTTLRAMVRGSELLIVGTKSIEFWSNVGTTFPFQRVTAIDVGCASGSSVVAVDNEILFIDDHYQVQALSGYEPTVISTPWVTRRIRESARPQSIVGSLYRRDGHAFYSISTDEFTLVFDALTKTWHEEESEGLARRKVNIYEQFGDKIVAGNYKNGTLYLVDREAHQDGDGDRIFMRVDTPCIHAWPARLKIKALYLDHIAGQGRPLEPTDDADPKIQLWISEDMGQNFWHFDDFEIGDINERLVNIQTHGLGTPGPDGYVLSFRCPCNVNRGLLQAMIDVEPLLPRRTHG